MSWLFSILIRTVILGIARYHKKHSKGKSAEILQETYELEDDRNTELQNEGSGYSQKVTDENVELGTPEETTSQFTVTLSTSRGNKRGSSNNVAKKGGYSSNVESIHGAIQKLEKISDENKKQTEIHEFDAFCNSLAIQLKKMPLRQALICQEKLQAVMTQHRLSLLSSEKPTSPLHMYTSTPSPASTFSGQASQTFYPETSPHNDPSYQEEPNEREESVKCKSINTTSLERCYIIIMKLHVSAYNGHRQVSATIKKSLYICVRAC